MSRVLAQTGMGRMSSMVEFWAREKDEATDKIHRTATDDPASEPGTRR